MSFNGSQTSTQILLGQASSAYQEQKIRKPDRVTKDEQEPFSPQVFSRVHFVIFSLSCFEFEARVFGKFVSALSRNDRKEGSDGLSQEVGSHMSHPVRRHELQLAPIPNTGHWYGGSKYIGVWGSLLTVPRV